ncbi:hypothetical protein [Chitinophaga agri]|uniref:Uncharacterized protein n=1 Tax=Chitinophaga agri TaxID=2703787 RepID=A0A6B9ZJH7_9BACT|nr:hypothetical protein [Chitinophaga agri]QHS62580.1 hypothetical protein GWR21_24245 [Chitinophaga agri]
MVRRNAIIGLAIIMFALIGYYYYNYSYVEMEPLVKNTFSGKAEKIQVDTAFYQRLAFILEKEGQAFQLDDAGSVMLLRVDARDEAFVLKYTDSAKDSTRIKVLQQQEKTDNEKGNGK